MDLQGVETALDRRVPPVQFSGVLIDDWMRNSTIATERRDPLLAAHRVGEFVWTTPTGRRRRYVRNWTLDVFVLTPGWRR